MSEKSNRYSFNLTMQILSPTEEQATAIAKNYCKVANTLGKDKFEDFQINFQLGELVDVESPEDMDQQNQAWKNVTQQLLRKLN